MIGTSTKFFGTSYVWWGTLRRFTLVARLEYAGPESGTDMKQASVRHMICTALYSTTYNT